MPLNAWPHVLLLPPRAKSQKCVANDGGVNGDDLSSKIALQTCNFLQTPGTDDGGVVDGDPVLYAGGDYYAGDYVGGFQMASS